VLLAIPSGGVLFATTGNLAYLAAIDPLSLWSEPAISPHLLVVPEAIPFGDLGFTASLYQAPSTPFLVFALGRKPAMPADLLIVTGTVPGRASFPPTPLCFANRPPLGLDNFCFHFASFLGISSFCLKISKYNATFEKIGLSASFLHSFYLLIPIIYKKLWDFLQRNGITRTHC
jgi:hypothetical protein